MSFQPVLKVRLTSSIQSGKPHTEFKINQGTTTIGRYSSNTIYLRGEQSVSNNHAQIEFINDKVTIQDLRSLNKTQIQLRSGEKEIQCEPGKSYELFHGSKISFGSVSAQIQFIPIIGSTSDNTTTNDDTNITMSPSTETSPLINTTSPTNTSPKITSNQPDTGKPVSPPPLSPKSTGTTPLKNRENQVSTPPPISLVSSTSSIKDSSNTITSDDSLSIKSAQLHQPTSLEESSMMIDAVTPKKKNKPTEPVKTPLKQTTRKDTPKTTTSTVNKKVVNDFDLEDHEPNSDDQMEDADNKEEPTSTVDKKKRKLDEFLDSNKSSKNTEKEDDQDDSEWFAKDRSKKLKVDKTMANKEKDEHSKKNIDDMENNSDNNINKNDDEEMPQIESSNKDKEFEEDLSIPPAQKLPSFENQENEVNQLLEDSDFEKEFDINESVSDLFKANKDEKNDKEIGDSKDKGSRRKKDVKRGDDGIDSNIQPTPSPTKPSFSPPSGSSYEEVVIKVTEPKRYTRAKKPAAKKPVKTKKVESEESEQEEEEEEEDDDELTPPPPPSPPKPKLKPQIKSKAGRKGKEKEVEEEDEELKNCNPPTHHKILFSMADEEYLKTMTRNVKILGGSVATSSEDATHLVIDDIKRSKKVMECILLGRVIVTSDWLKESKKKGSFIDEDAYVVKDRASEEKYKFVLSKTLQAVRTRSEPLFKDCSFYITNASIPPPDFLNDLVELGGGILLDDAPATPSKSTHTLIIANQEKDRRLIKTWLSNGFSVYLGEFILLSILHQKLDFKSQTIIL